MESAVLFLIFNRPEPTTTVFEAIRRARPPRLYIAADAPRSHKAGEAELCARSRQIVTNVDWPCEVRSLLRDENLGCRRAVSSAISWFFEHEEQGIILEDDCLPAPDFFRFCDQALARWKDDERVMHVGGSVLLERSHRRPAFSRLIPIWGWATWRRAWRLYDSEMEQFEKLQRLPLQQWYGSQHRNVIRAIKQIKDGNVDAWGARWVLSVLARSGFSLLPPVNLISNIGFGAGATHTKVVTHLSNVAVGRLVDHIPDPPGDNADPAYDEAYLKILNKNSNLMLRAMKKLVRALGMERD